MDRYVSHWTEPAFSFEFSSLQSCFQSSYEVSDSPRPFLIDVETEDEWRIPCSLSYLEPVFTLVELEPPVHRLGRSHRSALGVNGVPPRIHQWPPSTSLLPKALDDLMFRGCPSVCGELSLLIWPGPGCSGNHPKAIPGAFLFCRVEVAL